MGWRDVAETIKEKMSHEERLKRIKEETELEEAKAKLEKARAKRKKNEGKKREPSFFDKSD